MGPISTTDSSKKYILVVGDYFTKWKEAFAVPNQEAKTISKKVVKEVISRYGAPEKIHSDQGQNFETQLFQEICVLFNMDKTRTSPYHPESVPCKKCWRSMCLIISMTGTSTCR